MLGGRSGGGGQRAEIEIVGETKAELALPRPAHFGHLEFGLAEVQLDFTAGTKLLLALDLGPGGEMLRSLTSIVTPQAAPKGGDPARLGDPTIQRGAEANWIAALRRQ